MEAFGRGKAWQRLTGEGLGLLHPATRDRVLRTVGAPRAVVPGLDLRFVPERARYDADLDEVRFFAFAGQESLSCAINRDALEAAAGIASLDRDGCMAAFRQHRHRLELATRAKYRNQPVDAVGEVRLTRADLEAVKLPS